MDDIAKRNNARLYKKYYDRVPVGFCIEPRYICKFFKIPLGEYYKSAKIQLELAIEYFRFQVENIPCDNHAGPNFYITPYFENVKQASAFGCEVIFPDDETLHGIPFMTDPAQMETVRMPDPESGLWGTNIKWWHEMKEIAGEYKLKYNDTDGVIHMAPLHVGGLSPHMVAVDMAGTEFYYWMAECPDLCHKFLRKITEAMCRAEDHVRKIDGMDRGYYALADDSAAILSARMYRDIAMPYTKYMFDRYGADYKFGRNMHICGAAEHLLDILADDLQITSFDVFGYQIPPKVAAKKLGGKVYLWGNINPMLVKDGKKSEVMAACTEALEAMAPCGGFVLGDGANICPGSPLENLAVFVEASQKYGVPDGMRME